MTRELALTAMATDHFRFARRRRKILFIDNSLHVTGAFKAMLAIADAIADDFEVEVILSTTSALKATVVSRGHVCHQLPLVEIGRDWLRLARYIPQLITNTFWLRRFLNRQSVDIIIMNDYYNLLGAMVRLSGWPGQIITFVRLLPSKQNRLLNKLWSSLAIGCSNYVVAVSLAVKRDLPFSDKIHVIYDAGLVFDKYPDWLPKVKQDCFVTCLYPSNYIAGKGHETALDGFALAYRANPDLRLRFLGSDMGLKKNAELKAALRKKAEMLGLGEVVTFESFADDIESEIKRSDVVLNFSHSESFSMTCLEACAYGRPVVATRCGGPEEIIEDGVSGLLVPVGDASAIAEALLKLSNEPKLRAEMGRSGRALVGERFSRELQFRQLRQLIEQ